MTDAAVGWVLAVGSVAIAIVVWLLAATWRRKRLLERLLDHADGKLERLQRQFERFAPADVVERLSDDDAGADVVPERREVTMLFADLRGFTAICDRLDPALAVDLLNGYFLRMNRAITRHHGHTTELVGDGLLALFGALEDNSWQARDAVLAALAMRGELAQYNDELRARGLPQLRFGIGIHGGEVVAGVMGTAELVKFSVTGDPINVASRIEGLTSRHGVDILVSAQVHAAVAAQFEWRVMPPATVKGKSEPLETYHVIGPRADTPADSHPDRRV